MAEQAHLHSDAKQTRLTSMLCNLGTCWKDADRTSAFSDFSTLVFQSSSSSSLWLHQRYLHFFVLVKRMLLSSRYRTSIKVSLRHFWTDRKQYRKVNASREGFAERTRGQFRMCWYQRIVGIEENLRRRHRDKISGTNSEVRQDRPASPYHDQALKSQEIRFLAINSTAVGLCIRTTRHNLSGIIEYDAISYVWGTEQAPVTVPCNDGCLQITPGVYEMLERLHLYRPVSTRPLWIDAICS